MSPAPPARPRLLVVDDEPTLLKVLARRLTAAGFDVVGAGDGVAAFAHLREGAFDAIVSDIDMPGMTGLHLLRAVRQRDLDVPVVLMTGKPDVATAVEAIADGVLRYLVKPVDLAQLVPIMKRAVQLNRMASLKREALALSEDGPLGNTDRPALQASFERVLGSLHMAYQPILRADGSLFGFEALLRSRDAALPHPGAVLDAAARLGRMSELGTAVRAAAAQGFAAENPGGALFVNLHSSDLDDDDLYAATAPLTRIADRVVLEITERASLDTVHDARGRIAGLRRLGFRVAIDDLGAGYAGLTSFATLEPDIVKLDMSLVRDVGTSSVKRKLVGAMAALCRDLGILVVAEGVETPLERDTVLDLGCELVQGYLFARPGPPFPSWVWA